MIRKTAVITAASIAGVVLAGGAAVGANIGILNAADDTDLGSLSADAAVTVPTDTAALPSDTTAGAETQAFAVDAAGTVTVESTDAGLRMVEVLPAPGWTWNETSTGSDAVAITFRSATDTLEFVAEREADGTITGRVDRPNSETASGTVPSGTVPSGPAPTVRDDDSPTHDLGDDHGGYDDSDSDDDHDDEYDDSDDDSDDDHDDDRDHEGHDDDD